MQTHALFKKLESSQNILLSGAGGGLDAVAERVMYLDWLKKTNTSMEISLQIKGFRGNLKETKEWETIPV